MITPTLAQRVIAYTFQWQEELYRERCKTLAALAVGARKCASCSISQDLWRSIDTERDRWLGEKELGCKERSETKWGTSSSLKT